MNKYQNLLSLSSFSKIILFSLLGLVGFMLISFLSVRLEPQQNTSIISITYLWTDQNPRIIESEVTTKLEQSLSKLNNLINISSLTSKGKGSIRLEFSKDTDLDKKSLYVSSIIRQIYPLLPEGVSFPNIKKHGINNTEKKTLMSLNVSGVRFKKKLNHYTENTIIPELSRIKGVTNVDFSGVSKYRYVILCKNSELEKFNVDLESIKSLIVKFFKKHSLGIVKKNGINTAIKVGFKKKNDSIYDILKLYILNKENKIIPLKNIISISEKENKLQGYKKYNGRNALTINIFSDKKENQLKLSKTLRKEIEILNKKLRNKNLKINIIYDSTRKLSSELNKVIYRTMFSLGILLFFVFLTNRVLKYVFLILSSLILNILISVIFYYFLSVDIHLYSLAGLTISLGIIIDNTIIMADHLINNKNKKVFIPILAATTTSIGALIMIFFLQKEYQLYLIDFSYIIIINLTVSLLTTFFLVPSLFEKLKLEKKPVRFNKKKNLLIISNIYQKGIEILIRRKILVYVFFIFFFGLPLFLIPKEIKTDSKVARVINPILQNEFYKKKLFPNFKYIGGTLYTFLKNIEKSSFISSPRRLSIKIRISNPEGGTIEQLDKSLKLFEQSLIDNKEVDFFITDVNSSNYGFINVFIKEEYENTDAPYILKNELEAIAIQIGGMNCSIFGVGQPFNNGGNLTSDASIKIKGYNLDHLLKLANKIKDSILLEYPRINNVKINSERSWVLKDKYEYVLNIKSSSPFNKVGNNNLIEAIKWNSGNEFPLLRLNNKSVVIVENKDYLSKFQLENSIISKDSTYFNVGRAFNIEKKNVMRNIVKVNSNYEVFLDYNFAGTYALNNTIYKEVLKKIETMLPIGYEASHPDDEYFERTNSYSFFRITLIILLIIYFTCSILFESLTLPLVIILTIPISFIGVFLTFSLFDIPFDQGGLASFIMLSGIVVNSSIFILNQYKNLEGKNLSSYIKAFNQKITPIFLTITSTILGLLPFVIIEGNNFFWTSFAYGNIGGLIFSFVVILVFLPLCLKFKTQKI